MAPENEESGEIAARVRDFIDDKLQNKDDFRGLDVLLDKAREQQGLLKKQLEEAQLDLVKINEARAEQERGLRVKTEAFQRKQSEIDRQLLAVTKSKTSDEAALEFGSSMGKLRSLELTNGYLELLKDVGVLGRDARAACKKSPRTAIPSYKRVHQLSRALKEAQPAAEGAAPHLVDHVQQEVSQIYTQIREALSATLSATMEKLNWPGTKLKLDSTLTNTWTEQAGDLLELQDLDLAATAQSPAQPSSDPVILLPLQVMVKPLQLRFRYHFYGDRPTNRLDKPEYFLSHIFDILEDHYGFVVDYVQPLLDVYAGQSDDLTYPDAMSAFISALLPMVQKKVLSLLNDISQQPQLLSHLIHELMTFDTTLRLAWGYVPIPHAIIDWKGLTWSVLVTYDYFNPWLNVEKDFALSRYEAIISSPDGRDLDYESLESGSTKPTKSAIRVNDLLETVTDRYRPLSSFSQKLRFLIEIQLEIFDQYHQRLHGSLERYIMDTSTLGKVIQSGSGVHDPNTPNLQGRFGLESLVKVFGSADYLEHKMADWGDDVFFLELWDELQDRARRNGGRSDASIGRDLAVSDVASRTSTSIALDGPAEGDASGALFDETASAYRRLRLKAEGQIQTLLINAVIASLRPYARSSGWTTISSHDTSDAEAEASLTPSAALDTSLTLIHEYLSFLATVLASAPLRRTVKALCGAVQRHLWENVLLRCTFSVSGAKQLRLDVRTIKGVINGAVGRGAAGEADRAMGKLDAGIRLLGLPVRGAGERNGRKENTAREKDVDQDDSDTAQDQSTPDENHTWSLEEVENLIFQSNEAARQVLADMDLWALSETEARKILGRRVEVGR